VYDPTKLYEYVANMWIRVGRYAGSSTATFSNGDDRGRWAGGTTMQCLPATRHYETALADTSLDNASQVRADRVGVAACRLDGGSMSGQTVRRNSAR
jgi:hypothetical protein